MNKRGQFGIVAIVLVAFLALMMYFLFNFAANAISLSVPQFSPDEANVCNGNYLFGECLGNLAYYTLLASFIILAIVIIVLLFALFRARKKGKKR